MNTSLKWLFLFISLFSCHSLANSFDDGVQLYQQKKFDQAKVEFEKAFQENPNNAAVLTNWALAEFQLGKKGWAVALLRRAINLNPNFSTSKAAYDFILPQLDVKEIPHEIQFSELMQAKLQTVSLQNFLLLTVILLAASGWLWLRFVGRRKTALASDKPSPPFPTVAIVLSIVLLLFAALSMFKLEGQLTPRGTIVAEKQAAYSLPDEKSAALFDLYQGLEVLIQRVDNDWVQVTYPGGLTGWIPKNAIFQTSGGH
jgi:tetratricopeptide (TPR) repeat protein